MMKPGGLQRLIKLVFIFFAISGTLCAGQADLAELYKAHQPEDPFIDALKSRIKGAFLFSYAAYRDGIRAIEATGVIPYSGESVLSFYKEQFDSLGIPYQVKKMGDKELFLGEINGEEKRAFVSSLPGGTLVHLSSAQSRNNFSQDYPSLVEEYPELRDMGGKVTIHNEQHQGVSRSGMLKYEFEVNNPEYALSIVRNRLLGAGWKRGYAGVPIEGVDDVMCMLEKGTVSISIMPANQRKYGVSGVFLYFEDTFGTPGKRPNLNFAAPQ